MKNNSLLSILSILFSLSALTFSCSSGGDSGSSGGGGGNNGGGGSQQVIPSNLVVNVTIEGQDDQNPNGDGSGQVSVTATATNTVRYGFKVGNSGTETQNTTGLFSYTVTDLGTNQFPLYVYAYSSTDDRISKITNLTVYVLGSGGSGDNDVLVWSDEFDGNGVINPNIWTYELGNGSDGWGNQEVQNYTSSSSNIKKEGGILKITAIKESNGAYTSARIKTQDKFEFKYGLIEIRAKLPSAQGTWPALWMLGSNFSEVGWPQCGEIDIMEQFEDKNRVKSTLHWKLSDGERGEYGLETANNTSSDWHIYSIDWTPTSIKSYLDGVEYFSMNTVDSGVGPYFPFNENFFLIFNLAMGGTLGGEIDPNFTQDVMEVDYIRLYQ